MSGNELMEDRVRRTLHAVAQASERAVVPAERRPHRFLRPAVVAVVSASAVLAVGLVAARGHDSEIAPPVATLSSAITNPSAETDPASSGPIPSTQPGSTPDSAGTSTGSAPYLTVIAHVVDSGSAQIETVEIDRGSSEGIKVGMAVVDAAGLVGRITTVDAEHSIVQLITDPAFTVECTVTHARRADGQLADALAGIDTAATLPQATVASTADASVGRNSLIPEAATLTSDAPFFPSLDGACRGRGVDQRPDMQSDTAPQAFTVGVGDLVTTTGGSTSLAPPNIIIGAVTNKVSSASSWLLEIEPAADIEHVDEVSVVLYRPAQ